MSCSRHVHREDADLEDKAARVFTVSNDLANRAAIRANVHNGLLLISNKFPEAIRNGE